MFKKPEIGIIKVCDTDRKIPAVEWMNDKSLVANMDDSGHPVARVECR